MPAINPNDKMREALRFVRDEFRALQDGSVLSSDKILAVVEDALNTPVRNCDFGTDWLEDFYCFFTPPKGMREMPPEWVDCITAYCKWLVTPVKFVDEEDKQ